MQTQLVVIGGGPGGYAAAFLAADEGLQVVLVDAEGRLGGTCFRNSGNGTRLGCLVWDAHDRN